MTRILVIEDEKDEMKNICFFLQHEGYETIMAENGRIGVEKAKSEKPDLIICDLNLPELPGYEAIDEIRKFPETSQIPIIILTVYPEPAGVDSELRSRVQDYIVKPFYFKDFLARIKSALEERT